MGVGAGPRKELEKTARAAPGTGPGDNTAMGTIDGRSSICLSGGPSAAPRCGWSSNASHVDL